ncbi:RHS repeat-associated protein [Tahibacter aquaticus]|uniref:RHS repeat-associated protein n=1 Tax=Tahibacter aquaticus TaxID=520092 RepID=A0A4V3DM64_9GAMM|nr:RHS repeat-associated core domain-containing protein [Tahibacter aquaticus]TDR43059.1 RHS repeat-associated protein [Tahibacter aquaticus]
MFTSRSHTGQPRQGPLSFTTLRGALLTLSLLFATPHANALLDKRCNKEGGDLECVPPNQDPQVCVGGASIASSDPPCGLACKTPSQVIDAVSANWVKTFPLCSALEPMPCRDVTTQPNTQTKYMGLVIRHELSFDAKSACNDNPSGYVTNCAGGDGLAIDCKAPVICPPTYGADLTINMCTRPRPKACPAGNPIQCAGGQKLQHESDIPSTGPGTLSLSHHYSSSGFYNSSPSKRNFLGPNWRHSYQRTLQLETATPPNTLQTAFLVRADGKYSDFRLINGAWVGRKDQWESLEEIIDQGVRTGWRYTTPQDEIEHYDLQGRLLSISTRSGLVTALEYSTASTPASIAPEEGLLVRVTDALGRTLDFRYTKETYPGGVHHPRRLEIIDSIGNVIAYEFDPKERLVRTIYPEGKTRQYIYNETAPFTVSEGWHLLTGIIDENGQRFATYKYSGDGRAVEEWHGSSNADYLKVSYTAGFDDTLSKANLLDGLGSLTKRRFRFVNGAIRDEGVTRCDNPGCSSASLQKTTKYYDANGNPRLSIDYKGTITDYDYNDQALETARRENFSEGPTTCPAGTSADSNNYTSTCLTGTCWRTTPFTGSSNAAEIGWTGWHYSCRVPTTAGSYTRATETIWHASLRAPLERDLRNSTGAIESKTRWAYNSRGQVVARCEIDIADAAAMAYTCSDTTAPAAGARVRRWTYAYCEAGDVAASNSTCPILGYTKSVNGPRLTSDAGMNGLDDIISYAYYPSTDETGCGTLSGPCHRKGDLSSATDALGHISETIAYDRSGRILRTRDANNVIVDVSYDARGRLLSQTTRALSSGSPSALDATISFTYDHAGQVTRITEADGTYVDYGYDDAHRLVRIIDRSGNRIHYTLDAAGNPTKDEIFDATYNAAVPGASLKHAIVRQYNVLGRISRTLNVSGQANYDSSTYDSALLNDGYDANGNRVEFADGRGTKTQRTYDPLNRLARSIEDITGTSLETANATTDFGYDTRDTLRSVKDPDGLITTFTVDSLGNLLALDSPDTAHSSYTYDGMGNRLSQTDARGTVVTHIYDALNRQTSTKYPTVSLNTSFYYDETDATTGCNNSYPVDRLTRIVQGTNATTYCYDFLGNVTRKSQNSAGITLAIHYSYNAAGRVETITYPDGGTAIYGYDLSGRINSLSWKSTPAASPLAVVAGISYYPFGPMNKLSFGNGRTLTSVYDSDYVIDRIVSSSQSGLVLEFDRDALGNITGASATIDATTADRTYIYDRQNRLSKVFDSAGSLKEEYRYNKTGDRTFKQREGQPAQTSSLIAGTHRLGIVGGATRTYDPNGNTIDRGDGATLSYDASNRLAAIALPGNATAYEYSGEGERLLKSRANGGTTVVDRYTYSYDGMLLAERRDVTGSPAEHTSYLYVGRTPVAQVRNAVISYIEADHLGTSRVAVDPVTNAAQWRWDWLGSGFGENTAMTIVPGKAVNLRYPGQILDEETQLHHNRFRSYEATLGRYLESDPSGINGGTNTYGYAYSNPLLFIDEDGLQPGIPAPIWHPKPPAPTTYNGRIPPPISYGGRSFGWFDKLLSNQVIAKCTKGFLKINPAGTRLVPNPLGVAIWGMTPTDMGCATLECHPEYRDPQPPRPSRPPFWSSRDYYNTNFGDRRNYEFDVRGIQGSL